MIHGNRFGSDRQKWFYYGLTIIAALLLVMGLLAEVGIAIAKRDKMFSNSIISLLRILTAGVNLTGLGCYVFWLLLDSLEENRKAGSVGLWAFVALLAAFFLGLYTKNEFLHLLLLYLFWWLSVILGFTIGFWIIGNATQMAETFRTTASRIVPPNADWRKQKRQAGKKSALEEKLPRH